MLNQLKKLFQSLQETASKEELDFNTALAALLVEVMRADGKLQQSEFDKIAELLKTRCELPQAQVTTLIDEAQQLVEQAVDMYSFAKQINNHTNDVERIEVIELLWHVAYADGELDSHEDHIIRKIAGLFYVAHADFIAAKLRAKP
ncbi:TerB family tellurite resistance protein [Pseudoalteromonas sp. J010]|uniref:tellurite resistance TerB family protein n=1 Tax=Pseudoalteromonas sp. J010 TaxID=998465 RepID=UPI000F645EB1|nr:TerB family tellurite resistance protein [Pseudoalteromonas sp. J010]RRS09757.1 TerB family tellurite resistance protein [Pseudoalteromonas sp. J010]